MSNYTRNFKEILQKAAEGEHIIAGFNVFGIDEAPAVIKAAEALNAPVILGVNKVAMSAMPVECWGEMLRSLAKRANVPVCVHLDHATDLNVIKKAVKAGFDSIMYDGSQLPLEENIRNTREVVSLAHAHGVLVEAEIGAVGYSDGAPGAYKAMITDPKEAGLFARDTHLDWLAISIGNVHRMEVQGADVNFELLAHIEKEVSVPLVIHGSTGICDEDMRKLMCTRVAKVNIGTALRMAFGTTLRKQFELDPHAFDRTKLFVEPLKQMQEVARNKMQLLGVENLFSKEMGK